MISSSRPTHPPYPSAPGTQVRVHFAPSMQRATFDVVADAARCLRDQPNATEDRPIKLHLITSIFLGFFLLETVLWMLLPRVLPQATPREARVKIREALISSVHDVVSVPFVFHLMHSTSLACDAVPSPKGFLGFGPLAHTPMRYVDLAGSVLVGFLLWNSAHYIWHHKVYASSGFVSNLVHHAAFITMVALNADTLWCNWAFGPLYMGEWSTFFLNVRLIYRLLDCEEMLVSALFALLFFLTRVVVFGLLAIQLVTQAPDLIRLLHAPQQISYLILLPAMYGLNLFWFYKIVLGIARVLAASLRPGEVKGDMANQPPPLGAQATTIVMPSR